MVDRKEILKAIKTKSDEMDKRKQNLRKEFKDLPYGKYEVQIENYKLSINIYDNSHLKDISINLSSLRDYNLGDMIDWNEDKLKENNSE